MNSKGMNLTTFVITMVCITGFLTGILITAGDVFQQASVTDSSGNYLAGTNATSQGMISVANQTYQSSKDLSPITSTGSFNLVTGMLSALSIIGSSITSIPTIISEVSNILGIPSYVFGIIMAIAGVVMALTIFKIIRGGLTNV